MELGNMIFGNSRGSYHIERDAGYEEQLERLFDAYASDRDNSWREYGVEFENEVFAVFPYYWGDCTCGFDEMDMAWWKAHLHGSECYQTALRKGRAANRKLVGLPVEKGWFDGFDIEAETPEPGVKILTFAPKEDEREAHEKSRQLDDELYEKLCAEYGLPAHGCAIHCTCGVDNEYDKWREAHDHDPQCPLVKSNFLHKPTGFSISWYKYPLRDSYMSEQLTVRQFAAIVDKCVESLEA